jgi:Domain of unknown function (DUF1876)
MIMTTAKKWTVDIYVDEHPETRRTRAEARLHTGDLTDVRGVGTSSRNPRDPEVPEIGDELAVARALADLADNLRAAAAGDIEAVKDATSHRR